jgi:hypothetical protein
MGNCSADFHAISRFFACRSGAPAPDRGPKQSARNREQRKAITKGSLMTTNLGGRCRERPYRPPQAFRTPNGSGQPVRRHPIPNFSWLRVGSRTFRVWHPRPDKIEVLSWVYSDKPAPPHVKEAVRLAGVGGLALPAASSRTTWTTGRNAPAACRGAVSRRAFLNTQMGLGYERFDPDLNAWASDFRMSESNHRQFYRR